METHFTIPGKPQGKARPRVRRDGHAYTPEHTTRYEELVRWCWHRSGAIKLNGAIRAVILARYPVPKCDSKKTQNAKICGEIPCTIKPDCDNVAKIVLDALNGLAYIELIKRIPTADVEPVVHCRDCKHRVEKWYSDKRMRRGGYQFQGCDIVENCDLGKGAKMDEEDTHE